MEDKICGVPLADGNNTVDKGVAFSFQRYNLAKRGGAGPS
jgi:hypothetical protein